LSLRQVRSRLRPPPPNKINDLADALATFALVISDSSDCRCGRAIAPSRVCLRLRRDVEWSSGGATYGVRFDTTPIVSALTGGGRVPAQSRTRAHHSVLRNLAIVVDDPLPRCARHHRCRSFHRSRRSVPRYARARRRPDQAKPTSASFVIIGRPDRPNSIFAPNRNHKN
jgi:hypothetical protein